MADPPAAPTTGQISDVEWETVQASPEFAKLRHALRSFVFPVTIAFLVWYFTYVLCAAFARPFMNIQVFGHITVGLLFGVLQFISTFLIALWYAKYADKKFDPLADKLRDRMEGAGQ